MSPHVRAGVTSRHDSPLGESTSVSRPHCCKTWSSTAAATTSCGITEQPVAFLCQDYKGACTSPLVTAVGPRDEVSVAAMFALSDDCAAEEPVLADGVGDGAGAGAATAVLAVGRTTDEAVVLPVPTVAAAAAVVAASTVADSAVAGVCADSAAVEAVGRAIFGRGAERLAEDVEDDDVAGRLSLSLDFDTLPLPCLSGQSMWQQACALPGRTNA